MVHARLPEHVLAAHALEADHDVLQRIIQRMSHVQRTGHVRRRDDDREGLGAGLFVGARAERIGLIPFRGDFRFDCGGIIRLVEHFMTKLRGFRMGVVNRMADGKSIKKPPRRPERLVR